MKKATLTIEGVIGTPDMVMMMFGECPHTSASDVLKFLDDNQGIEELELLIDSDGGSVHEGFKIYDILKDSGIPKITASIYNAASIATVISLAANKDDRWISEHSPYHIHNAGFQPETFFSKERWTADDLDEMAEDVKKTDLKILDHYIKHLGEDKREQLIEAMAADKDLGAAKAIELGFCSGYIKDKPKEAKSTQNIVLTDTIINKVKSKKEAMADDNKEVKSLFQQIMDAINGKKKTPEATNVQLKTTDGTTISVEEGEGGDLVGQTAYKVDAEGNVTEEVAEAGDHELEDGRTVVIGENGAVTEVKEAEGGEETDAERADRLQAELDTANETINSLTTERDGLKAKVQTQETNITNIKSKMEELRNHIPGLEKGDGEGNRKPAGAKKEYTDEELAKLPYHQRVAIAHKKAHGIQ